MHHANLLIGSKEWALAQIPEGDATVGLDVSHRIFDRMSIADVRVLSYDASLTPIERPYRTFIIVAANILHEAQNALLKLFEEPNETTVFYLILQEEHLLLPTLRSRLHLLGTEELKRKESIFRSFLDTSYANRLSMIAEKLKADDTEWVTELMRGFEVYAHEAKDSALMSDVIMTLSYINAPGSSKKMLLEHLALSL
jgi:hypothetical protein